MNHQILKYNRDNAVTSFPPQGENSNYMHLENVNASALNATIGKTSYRDGGSQLKSTAPDYPRLEYNVYNEIHAPDTMIHRGEDRFTVSDASTGRVPAILIETENMAYEELPYSKNECMIF